MNECHPVHAPPNLCSAVSGGVKDHLLVGVPTVFALHLGTLIPAATVFLGEARVNNTGLLASTLRAYLWIHGQGLATPLVLTSGIHRHTNVSLMATYSA
jgi:hypothetical protein